MTPVYVGPDTWGHKARPKLKLGEIFAGYGGLGLAVESVFDAELAWYAEYDKAPSKIMAHHWPDVPNHKDVTTIDWSQVEPVDIISGGSPCQDLSLAGARRGMSTGTRSNLWESMREAIATIKPTYVVWENVRGALSATATSASDMEQREGFLGSRGGHLRALGRVLGDLADLGYDAQWRGLRAADVGAPHGRYRIFILATRRTPEPTNADYAGTSPAERHRHPSQGAHRCDPTENADRQTGDQRRVTTPGQKESGRARADTGRRSGTPTADTRSTTEREHAGEPPTEETGPASGDGLGDPSGERSTDNWRKIAADTACVGPGEYIEPCVTGISPTIGASSARAIGTEATPQPTSDRGREGWAESAREQGRSHAIECSPPTEWGVYAPAICRWGTVRGTASAPTELTPKGKHRLSARFAEWMMGLEPGWVTDVDISRNEQLKAIGNGVCPQQAAAALRSMLIGPLTPSQVPGGTITPLTPTRPHSSPPNRAGAKP